MIRLTGHHVKTTTLLVIACILLQTASPGVADAPGEASSNEAVEQDTGYIAGVVQDGAGVPLAGARLSIHPWGYATTVSADDGSFELEHNEEMRSGVHSPFWLVVQHPTQGLASAVEITRDSQDIRVSLTPGIDVSGRLIDEDGNPVAKAEVSIAIRGEKYSSLLRADMLNTNYVHSLSDNRGQFIIRCIPPGLSYRLIGEKEGYEQLFHPIPGTAPADSVELEPVTMKQMNAGVSGIVTSKTGTPLGGVTIKSSCDPLRYVITDNAGRFDIQICHGRVYLQAFLWLPPDRVANPGPGIRRGEVIAAVYLDAPAEDVQMVEGQVEPFVKD